MSTEYYSMALAEREETIVKLSKVFATLAFAVAIRAPQKELVKLVTEGTDIMTEAADKFPEIRTDLIGESM